MQTPNPKPDRHTPLTRSFVVPLTGSVAAAVLALGCDFLDRNTPVAPDPSPVKQTEETKPGANAQTPDSITDVDLKHAVVHRLFVNGIFPVVGVDVEVNKGIVELKGTAFSLFAKNQAENIVRTTKGVRGYIDRMTVIETDITDAELKARVDEALLLDPATESYEIDTKVQDGSIELIGEVDSWAEYGLAADVCASVMGVREVTNHLRIKAPPIRSEQEIQAEIVAGLRNDVLVDAAMVNVDVDTGVVKLSGVVGSAAEEARVLNKAWVTGVSRVDSDLRVEWWERDRFVSERSTALIPDVEIKGAVKDAIAFDARVNHDDIKVLVDGGRVTLSGPVPDLRSKKLAAETAQNTLGVTRVRNYLRVNPKDNVDDERLRDRVLRALQFNPYLTKWNGAVSAENGVVYLDGVVNTPHQKRLAEAVVSRVMGVAHIENNLRVFLQEAADMALSDDVEEELVWNVYVDRNDVDIAASRGMVTLSGEVESLRSYREAAAAARAAGAEVVFNQLKIAPRTAPPKNEADGS